MRALIAVFVATILVGCGSNPEQEFSAQEMALLQAQIEQQTLTVDCPAGCAVSYRDPRQAIVMPPKDTNGWDAMIAVGQSVERVVSTAVVPAAMGYVAVEGFKALQGSGAVTTNTRTTRVTNTDDSIAGDVVSGNSGMVNSQIDNTSTPTVVNQPAPVVVTTPDPVIVPTQVVNPVVVQ